ncbi:hypothetical protein [Anaerococcus cruorum]|uniref:hypothetical protein n=1 Tax=Anaerococcus sp. WGS1529 TaxID=3366812 RepID=UPI00372D50CC
MTPKKILIAALSFGLIFAGSSTPVFAQATEMTEEQKSEFYDRRNKTITEQKTKIEKLKKEINSAETEKSALEKTRNDKRKEIEQLNAQLKEKEEVSRDDLSDEETSKLDTEVENLRIELQKKEEELTSLEEEYRKKVDEYEYLQQISTRENALKNLYSRANSFLELDIADAIYEVRGYALENIIIKEDREKFVKELGVVKTNDELNSIKSEIETLVKGIEQPKEEIPNNQDSPNQEEQANDSDQLSLAREEVLKSLAENKEISDEKKEGFRKQIEETTDKEQVDEILEVIQNYKEEPKPTDEAESPTTDKPVGEDQLLEKPSADTPAKENEDKPKETPPTPNPDQKPKNDTSSYKPTISTDNDLPSLPETKPLDTPQDNKEDTNKDKTPVEKPKEETTSKPSQNYLHQILGKIYPNSATIRIINPSGNDYTTTIKITEEKPQPAKDTIIVKENYRYIKKGSHKVDDLKAKRDQLQKSIAHNKASVRAIELLEELTPKTVAKNRDKINALLKESERLIKEANYALAEYNYVLSK